MLIAKISVCIGFTAGVTKVDIGRIAELASFQRAKCLGFLSKRVQEGLLRNLSNMKVSGALDCICLRLCFVAEFQAEFQLFQLSPKAGLDAFH